MSQMSVLPFKISDMETIKNTGAIVDMSTHNFNIDITTEEDQINTTFIYLRNIGFTNLVLNFSNCSKELKVKYINSYIKTKYRIRSYSLSDIVIGILASYVYNDKDILYKYYLDAYEKYGFFTDKETIDFILENTKSVAKELLQFIVSTPLYLMMRFKAIDFDSNMNTSSYNEFGPNLYDIISNSYCDDILASTQKFSDTIDIAPKIYTNYFTEDNNDLFDSLRNSMSMAILFSLQTDKDNICKQILEESVNAYGSDSN